MPYLIRLWFGVREPVGQLAYALSSFGLMAFKNAAEALLIWVYTAAVYMPWHFLNPLLSHRTQVLQPAPLWVGWAIFAWSSPFLWVAVSMSIRRAAAAGASPWLGLMVLVPMVNLLFMPMMCLVPGDGRNRWSPRSEGEQSEEDASSAAMALGISLVMGGAMLLVSVYLLESYGASLFVGTPLLMGAVAAYQYNRHSPRAYGASVGLGVSTVALGGLALLLFALEGLICIVMALPLLLPLGALGGLLGKAIADSTRRPTGEILAAVLLLPLWALSERQMVGTSEFEVMTAIEIDAPPVPLPPRLR
jgi:hypothetical protein